MHFHSRVSALSAAKPSMLLPRQYLYCAFSLMVNSSDASEPTSVCSGFHVCHKITIWVPETCLLLSIGLIVGGIMHFVHEEPPAVLTSSVFFLYMLPPIVLDSGYFMPIRPFFENIGTVRIKPPYAGAWDSFFATQTRVCVCVCV